MPVIKVTQEMIDRAIPADSSHCMIADAVQATLPKAEFVAVDLATIRWSDRKKGLRYTFLTPRGAQWALVQFDQGVKPEPFSFILRQGQTTSMHLARNGHR